MHMLVVAEPLRSELPLTYVFQLGTILVASISIMQSIENNYHPWKIQPFDCKIGEE